MPKGKSSKRQRMKRMGDMARAHLAAKFIIPVITEDDLLAFQFSHFGDDAKPETFFVSAEDAINWQPATEEDDELGWYDDGVKRTLTDEQVVMFRHSEIARLKLSNTVHAEVSEEQEKPQQDSPGTAAEAHTYPLEPKATTELTDAPNETTPALHSHRSHSRGSSSSAPSSQRHRKKEIPYKQRHKRKWEKYVEEQNPEQGSMTHNRLLRELDEQRTENVAMDYGDDPTPAISRSSKPSPPSGRRIVSYAED